MTNRDDGHQLTTRLALAPHAVLEDFFGDTNPYSLEDSQEYTAALQDYFAGSPFSLEDLPLQVSYQDVPDEETAENANLMSLLHDNLGHPKEMLARHALRPLYVDSTNGVATLATQSETRLGIHQSMEENFQGLFAVNEQLQQGGDMPYFESHLFENRLDDLTQIADKTFGGVLDQLLDFRRFAAYGQMRDFMIPDNNRNHLYKNPKYISDFVKAYASLGAMMKKVERLAGELSQEHDDKKLAEAVRTYRTVLRHFQPQYREGLASGEIALLARRDLYLAHLLHLGQDWRTHCNQWELDSDGDGLGDVCTDAVSVSLFGRGTPHEQSNDALDGEEGRIKIRRGFTISREILSLAMIDDKDKFLSEMHYLLEKYAPKDYSQQVDTPISYRVADLDNDVGRL